MLLLFSLLFLCGNYSLSLISYKLIENNLVVFTALLLTLFLTIFRFTLKKHNLKSKLFLSLVIAACFGFLFGWYHTNKNINNKLPNECFKKQVYVKGRVSNLINKKTKEFKFEIDYVFINKTKITYNYSKSILVRLGFSKVKSSIAKLEYGDEVTFALKLRKIKNSKLQNYYFINKILCIGYPIKIVNIHSKNFDFKSFVYNKISNYSKSFNNKSLIHGLLLGDKSSISKEQKLLFQNTGVSHLLAISGMHLGAVFLFGSYISSFIWVLFSQTFYYKFNLSKKKFTTLFGLCFISFYGLISGVAIPTLRAYIFLIINSLSSFLSIKINKQDVIGLSIFFIALIDPYFYLDIGFWLSFILVAMLLYLNNIEKNFNDNSFKQIGLTIKLFVLSVPITLFFFQKISLVSPIVNFFAIPYINFLVLPLLILSLIFISNSSLSIFFLYLSDMLLEYYTTLLRFLDLQYFITIPINFSVFIIISFFSILLFMPRNIPGKLVGGLALSLVLFNYFNSTEIYYTMMETQKHNFISYLYS